MECAVCLAIAIVYHASVSPFVSPYQRRHLGCTRTTTSLVARIRVGQLDGLGFVQSGASSRVCTILPVAAAIHGRNVSLDCQHGDVVELAFALTMPGDSNLDRLQHFLKG